MGTGNLAITSITKVSQADAAYSLRKVNSSYSGDAVRIRRSSDDVEVDVAFDSDGKVSASSAITNIAEQGGETQAKHCLLYTSPSPRDGLLSRMPSSA